MGELAKLPNIGPVVEQQLQAVGVHTQQELARRTEKKKFGKLWMFWRGNYATALARTRNGTEIRCNSPAVASKAKSQFTTTPYRWMPT